MGSVNYKMIVLNFYGKIDRICISKKLGMYLSNLDDSVDNNWKHELIEQLKLVQEADKLYRRYMKDDSESRLVKLYHEVFPTKEIPAEFIDPHYEELVDRMICVTLDFEYDDMPLGKEDTNCFDSRFCEADYAEKIIDFMNFLTSSFPPCKNAEFPLPVPQWTYSSRHDELDHYRIFWGGERAEKYLKAMLEWGRLFDDFLVDRERYLQLDYLINSIYKDVEYNEYHLIKDFSLCQFLLENEKEKELDEKLLRFLPDDIPESEKKEYTMLLRQLRNKIAHGSVLEFERKIEEYIKKFMDGHYNFDYYEYSRKNWGLLSVCCLLDEILRGIIHLLLYDYKELERIKNEALMNEAI